MISCRNNIYS